MLPTKTLTHSDSFLKRDENLSRTAKNKKHQPFRIRSQTARLKIEIETLHTGIARMAKTDCRVASKMAKVMLYNHSLRNVGQPCKRRKRDEIFLPMSNNNTVPTIEDLIKIVGIVTTDIGIGEMDNINKIIEIANNNNINTRKVKETILHG